GVCGCAQRSGDAGYDLERDPVGGQRCDLLAAAAEDERIAALQTQHTLPPSCVLDEEIVDRFLPHSMARARLADIDAFGGARGERQDLRRNEVVVEDDLRACDQLRGAQRQEIGLAGPCADEIHLAASSSRARCRLLAARRGDWTRSTFSAGRKRTPCSLQSTR